MSGAGELAARLAADPVIGKYLGQERIWELLDPARYLGSTTEFIAAALRDWKERAR
ncbi:hypothetical protein [Nocardia sp. NPDC127526]|uniref:hypothetical protein n=1 Tax=Nocardia sp. NPDC127526 TaxID=3345393 RepID=UPI003642F3CA